MKDKTEVEFQAEWKKMGVPANETVLVAVSTGCDSMTLLSLLQRLPEKMNQNVLLKHIDKSKFKMKDEEELASVFHVIISMMIKNIIDYQNGVSAQNAKKSFKRDLDYLRYGIIK